MRKNSTLNYLKTGFIALCLVLSANSFAQTAGTLNFTVTTGGSDCIPCTDNAESASGHVLAIWIENSSNVYVKTLLRYANLLDKNGRDYDLASWMTSSSGDTVDAITGVTKFVQEAENASWDGKNVSGTLVADGSYTLWVEMAWDSEGGVITTSVPFTKGSSAVNLTPTATANFTNMSLTWTPSTVGINENNTNLSVYPNPASDLLTVELGNQSADTKVQLVNAMGIEVFSENFSAVSGNLPINLNSIAKGVYFVKIQRNNHNYNVKLVVE